MRKRETCRIDGSGALEAVWLQPTCSLLDDFLIPTPLLSHHEPHFTGVGGGVFRHGARLQDRLRMGVKAACFQALSLSFYMSALQQQLENIMDLFGPMRDAACK